MRARTILTLCCFLALLLTGATLFAEPAPALNSPIFDSAAPAPVCAAAPAAQNAAAGLGPVTNSACPVAEWQACFKRYGTCTLCFCLGSACECENRCV
jgi:hypothetical protein